MTKKGHGFRPRPPALRNATTKNKPGALMSVERISQSILILRGQRVLLDANLASLYGVPTGALVQAVKRNLERFPDDFMFQLTAGEWAALRSQFVISNEGRGGRRYAPYAIASHDQAIVGILKAIRELMHPPMPKKRPIGFTANLDESEEP